MKLDESMDCNRNGKNCIGGMAEKFEYQQILDHNFKLQERMERKSI
jgi:hypothetical protein